MYHSVIDDKYAIVLVYVDDLLLVGIISIILIEIIITSKFDMTILDDAKLYLRQNWSKFEIRIYVHQQNFIQKLLENLTWRPVTQFVFQRFLDCTYNVILQHQYLMLHYISH